jgi:hypothetical protein
MMMMMIGGGGNISRGATTTGHHVQLQQGACFPVDRAGNAPDL